MKRIESVCYGTKSNMPMERQAICFINGELESVDLNLENIKKAALIIAVDGGLAHCDRLHIQPHIIVGDLDSAPPSLLQKFATIEPVTFNRDKDETDFEKALEMIDFTRIDQVTILGWKSTTRTDHLLGNLFMAAKYPGKVLLDAADELAFVLSPANEVVALHSFPNQVVSIYPLSGEAAVISKGLKWELDGKRKLQLGFFSQSNECLNQQISVRVLSGNVVCIQEKDLGTTARK